MPATIAQLLDQRELGLRLMHGSPASLQRAIEWATATELLDPTGFLTSDQLVLTTGLRLRSARTQRAFVAALVASEARGVAFGVGFTHASVPAAIVEAAADADLPVLEVPYETSFSAITRLVSDARASEQFAALESRQRQQQQLVASLLGDDGLNGFVAQLSKLTGAHVAVTRFGEVLAGSLHVDDVRVTGWDALPVAASSSTQAALHVSQPRADDHSDEQLLTVARSLVSLHLSQESRRVLQSRTVAGQVIQDLVQGRLAPEDAAIRLGSIGHPEGGRTRVLVVESAHGADGGRAARANAAREALGSGLGGGAGSGFVSGAGTGTGAGSGTGPNGGPGAGPGTRARAVGRGGRGPASASAGGVLGLPLPQSLDRVAAAIVWNRLVVLLPAREPARESAEKIVAIARAAGVPVRIGIGDAYPAPRNLRWSYFEAIDSLAQLADGEEIGEQSRLSVSSLILASRDAPVRELAEEILAPLDRSDEEQGTSLVATLDTFLRRSGAVATVAEELGTHRNTVRYRIEQITQLTGLDPRVTGDAVQLWLALAARRIGA